MKIENWMRFRWDLTKLSHLESALPQHYKIERTTITDAEEVRKVISRSFVLDPSWNGAIREVMQTVNGWLDNAFTNEKSIVLVLRHGVRIIGAAAVFVVPEDATHLAPGPCVLSEYRNRGFATHLLRHALSALNSAGVQEATAIARQNSAAAKFLYPKFGGAAEPYDLTPLLAA